jgi:hypothetical protein
LAEALQDEGDVDLVGLVVAGQRVHHEIDAEAIGHLALSRIEAAAGRPFLARALETLLRRQREDGSFGSVAEDERALIAARTLIAVGRGSGN